ncbi:hypothetical protein JW824_06890 [bacterium]|nr:hypothetical protein [bacterium]
MHVVVLYGWKEETPEFIQAISKALGLTAYEIRQRLISGSPTVVASFADPQQAVVFAEKLNQNRIATLIVDATEVRNRAGYFIVRHFEFKELSLRIEAVDGRRAEIPYREIDVLLPGTNIVKYSETKTVTERKFSLGKTLLAGGIPMSKKVERQKDVAGQKYKKVLYLYTPRRQQPVVFSQESVTFEGLGSAMKISGEMNFLYMINELHRLSPGAAYDNRLLQRIGQVRLLGPTLNPEIHFDLAMEILAQILRLEPKSNNTTVP